MGIQYQGCQEQIIKRGFDKMVYKKSRARQTLKIVSAKLNMVSVYVKVGYGFA